MLLQVIALLIACTVLRLQVAREILVSERRYVHGLDVLHHVFQAPMAAGGLLAEKVPGWHVLCLA